MQKISQKCKKHKIMSNKKIKAEIREKGITLVALIITIIVLLILAGITINSVVGSKGILTKSKEVTNDYKQAAKNEEEILNTYETEMAEMVKMQENLLKSGEYAKETTKYNDGTKIATIPAGFTVSGFDGEKSINSGLVIYKGNLTGANWTTGKDSSGNDIKKTYNQYVWIPCTEEEYKRTEWGVEDDNGSKSFKDEVTLAGVTLSSYDQGNGITSSIINEIVKQISNEKASVSKYKGFYIGRYEVGEENVISQYKTPSANLIWSKAYENAKSIDVGSASVSYLCSSYAWDTALNFIQNNSEFTTYASTRDDGKNGTSINENWQDKSVTYKNENGEDATKAAGTATRLPTGVTTAKCNIYDMGGNVTEFTTELNPLTNGDNDATVVLRGGVYDYSLPAGDRYDANSAYYYTGGGFRATLFIQ